MSTKPNREVPAGFRRTAASIGRKLAPAIAIATFSVLPAACGSSDPVAEASALLEADRSAEAVEILREAVEDDPADPALNFLYGRALLANEQASVAAWPLRRAAQDPEYAVRAGLLLTQSLLATNNAYEAVRTVEEVLAIEPDNLMALRMRADARIGVNQKDEALEDLQRLVEAFPKELVHREKMLNLLLDKERFDDAKAVLSELAEQIAGRDDLGEDAEGLLCSRWVQLEVRQGHVEEAKQKIEECLAEHPYSRQVVNQAIAVYDSTGDEARSAEILRAAVEARPADLDLQNVLAERLDRADDVAEATRMLQETAERLDTPGAWFTLRNHQVQHDDVEGALASTDRLLQSIAGVPPTDPAFDYGRIPEQRLFEAAVVVAMAKDFERAEQMKSHLEEESHVHLLDARIHYERDELVEALDDWEEAFRLFPSNTGARHLAGLTALRLGQIDRGIEHLRNALRTRAPDSDVGVVLAQIYVAMGKLRLALDSLFYHLRENPDDLEALRLQSRIAMAAGNSQIAQSVRAKMAERDMGRAVADQTREIELRHGTEFALKFLDEGLQIDLDDPEHVDALAAWVERMLALDRGEAALARVAAAAGAHPDVADVAALHGATLAATGDVAAARRELERALALEPDNQQALVALARVDVAEGEVDAAVARFTRAAELQPMDPSPIYAAADALDASDRRGEADALLEKLLRDRPWEGLAAHLLAQHALESGEHGDDTLALAERAATFDADPGSAAFETLGRVHLARGEPDAAINALRHAASLGTPGPSGLYRIGTALSEAGDVEGAIKALETALGVEGFPEADEARKALARLQPSQEG